MRRIVLAGLVSLALLGALGYGLYWLLDTCRPLDRLFGVSGCAEVVRIADFDPLRPAALTSPDAAGQSSLFGHARTADGWRPAMVRLDLEAGHELSRHPVRALNAFGRIVLADDGERAMFTCTIGRLCTEDGSQAAILSLNDAAIIETFDPPNLYPVHFPGDAVPSGGDEWPRVYAAKGERIVAADPDSGLILLDAQGAEIATLIDEANWNLTVSDLSISPSGARIAHFDPARYDTPARLLVWDALTGETLLDQWFATSYRWGINPAWTADETHLTLIRRDGPDTLIELHRVAR